MTKQEKLKEIYNLLPKGAKQDAATNQGCSYSYFVRIVKGSVDSEEAIAKAIESSSKAMKDFYNDTLERAAKIRQIIKN